MYEAPMPLAACVCTGRQRDQIQRAQTPRREKRRISCKRELSSLGAQQTLLIYVFEMSSAVLT